MAAIVAVRPISDVGNVLERLIISYEYRLAVPEDAATCVNVRGKTRENAYTEEQLEAIGVTAKSWSQDIKDDSLPGYVCLYLDSIIGYCFGAKETGEIVVLALLPDHENQGVGKTLLTMMIVHFKNIGFKRLFLGCSTNPNVRSYSFYRHLNWQPTGVLDLHDDEILEYFVD